MKVIYTAFLLLVFQLVASAQQPVSRANILLQVMNQEQQPIEGATAFLLRAKDSVVVKTAISAKDGAVEFLRIAQGNYKVRINITGYSTFTTSVFEFAGSSDLKLPSITLNPTQKQLAGVTVESRKPFIERKIDRLIVNVENSIVSAGSSAFEVLERSPGIVIDQNDNISLKGRAGVIIMIDGRLSPLSGTDLASMLRGMNASAIERIEIIANPSSRFDAAGSAGIINIVMKKDKKLGGNGSLNLGMGQGIYNRTNGSINFNYRDKKVNVFGNFNYNYRKLLNDLTIDRKFYNSNGQLDAGLFLFNRMLYPTHTYNSRIGVDYFAGKKTIIGILVNGFLNDQTKYVDNNSTVFGPNAVAQSYIRTNSTTIDDTKHYGINLNFKHSIDSLGQEITVDLDRAVFNKISTPQFVTGYYDLNNAPIKALYLLDGNMRGDLTIHSIKSDYTKPLKKGGKIEAGFKSSFVKADNDLKFFDKSSGTPVYETGRSNHFIYDENINAAYLSLHKEWKKIAIQFGLRAEQANIKGVQLASAEKIDTSYLRIFPSAFMTYKMHKNHEFGFSFSRRIGRPTYNQLNPFRSFIDLTSFNTGNPFLRPEFTNSFELSYTLYQKTTLSLSYSRTMDVISWIIKPINTPDGPVSVETNDNISYSDFVGLNVSNQFSPLKGWNSVTNLNIFRVIPNGVIENTQASASGIVYNINNNQSFSLPKRWSAELSLNYSGAQQSAFAYSMPQWMLSAGVQKVIMGGKSTVRFNVSDIFWRFFPRVTSTFINYQQYFTAVRDTRIASLNFIYRFGKNTVAGSRRRTTGVEEEKSRAQ